MKTLAALVVCVFALSGAAVQAQTDQLVGTWVLNLEESRYSPGPAPKHQVTVYEAAGKGVKSTVTSTSADGKIVKYSFTTDMDGRMYP